MALMVSVIGLSGEVCRVQIGPCWTVRDLKVAVEQGSGVPRRQQRLLLGTAELHDGEALAWCLGGVALGFPVVVTLLRRTPEQAEWLGKVEGDWRSLREAPAYVQSDAEVVLRAVQVGGLALQFAAPGLRADREVVLAAVQQDGAALQHAAPVLRADRGLALAAVAHSAAAFQHAAEGLRHDRGFILEAVKADASGEVLKYISQEMRVDRELILAAVRISWRCLAHIPELFLADRDVVNAAALQNLQALRYVAATAGLEAGMPACMLDLCRGQRSEFGARVLLEKELCTVLGGAALEARTGTRQQGGALPNGVPKSRRCSRPRSCPPPVGMPRSETPWSEPPPGQVPPRAPISGGGDGFRAVLTPRGVLSRCGAQASLPGVCSSKSLALLLDRGERAPGMSRAASCGTPPARPAAAGPCRRLRTPPQRPPLPPRVP